MVLSSESSDTELSAVFRFVVELIAWVAGPWAVAEIAGSWWWAIPTAIVLIGLPATFNTPGDKNVTGIAISGRSRIAIEMLLLVVAIVSSMVVWPWFASVVVVGVMMLVTGRSRYRWLAGATAD